MKPEALRLFYFWSPKIMSRKEKNTDDANNLSDAQLQL